MSYGGRGREERFSATGGPYGRGGGRGAGGRGEGGGGGGPKKPPKCFRCGAEGHTSRDCVSDQTLEHKKFTTPPMPRHYVSFIDTHCHVDYMCEQNRVQTWGQFKEKVQLPSTYDSCITTFCDSTAILSSFSQYEDLVANHPDVYYTWGLHPHNAKYWNDRVEGKIMEMLSHDKCVGFGEIGLDVTSEKKGGSEEDQQVQVFQRQLELAQVYEKPIVIHYRGPGIALLDFLRPLQPTQKLHLHCWGDPSIETANKLMKCFPNLCFGFTGGIVGNMKMKGLLASLPPDRMILESDGPYMLPGTLKPPKGSKIPMPVNHPGNIPYTADVISQYRSMSLDRLLLDVQKNVKRLYGIAPRGERAGGEGAGKGSAGTDAGSSSVVATARGKSDRDGRVGGAEGAETAPPPMQVGTEENITGPSPRPSTTSTGGGIGTAKPPPSHKISLEETVAIYGDVLDHDTIRDLHADVRGNRVEVYSQLTALTGIDPLVQETSNEGRGGNGGGEGVGMDRKLSKEEWPEL